MAKWKNNGQLKLLIIVGTRPEIIRLAAVIKKCRKYFRRKRIIINIKPSFYSKFNIFISRS